VTVIQTSAAMAPTIVVVNQTSACGAFRAFDQGSTNGPQASLGGVPRSRVAFGVFGGCT
jgi:hypothetical protein